MENQPLNSNEHAKILVFVLLLLPSVIFGVGVIPALFLIAGVWMMKKNGAFSYIKVAVKGFKIYLYLLMAGFVCFSIFLVFASLRESWYPITWIIPCIIYLKIVDNLFYTPLYMHKEWIAVNGIFSNKQKISSHISEVNIIKGEKLKSYSVADELLKWAQLKEDGHISEEEYDEARKKLLTK